MKLSVVRCGGFLISLLISCNLLNRDKRDITFLISTSGCYKRCPIIDLKLQDNVIYFNFLEHTKYIGTYKYKLTSKDIITLNDKIADLNLESLDNEYSSDTPDGQMYNTSFTFMNKKRNVKFLYGEAPENFVDLVDYLISLRNKRLQKIDTIFNVATRKSVPYEKIEIPPMPRNLDSLEH